jgi:hypothetical protein
MIWKRISAAALVVLFAGAGAPAACTSSGPADDALGLEASGLDDSCQPACSATQMCCDENCVTRAVGDWSLTQPLARLAGNGCLEYRRYANLATSTPSTDPGAIQTLPDYSYAGYLGGGKAIPMAPVRAQVSPGNANDRQAIQNAITAVSGLPLVNGIRGAVMIRTGRYDIDGELVINASGVVLRGQGQGSGGTILRSVKLNNVVGGQKMIRVSGPDPEYIEGTAADITTSGSGTTFVVPVGSRSITVLTPASPFAVGQRVLVRRTPDADWISAIGMGALDPPWVPSEFVRDHERTVITVSSVAGSPARQTLTLDVPLVDGIESRFGGGQVVKVSLNQPLENVGIERLRMDSLDFVSAQDENHLADAIMFERARNSWVRQVTTLHFVGRSVEVRGGRFITVEDVAALDMISTLDSGRRYPFFVYSGTGILFQRCYARNARHNFVTNQYANGPNTWLDCAATKQWEDDGPHTEWATGLLFDNIDTGKLNVQNALDRAGTHHGWRGAQVMFWNSEATGSACAQDNNCPAFISETPAAAMNYGTGNVGPQRGGKFVDEPDGIWESPGAHVEPRSLYLQQLRDRLGQSAVDLVTTPEQRAGRLGNALRAWEGEGDMVPDPDCSTGILHSSGACCPAACGSCGGSGCSANAFGYDNCCSSPIINSGRSCLDYAPPCVVPTIDPSCKSGIVGELNGASACCDAACGTCGGTDCSQLPGGTANCCKQHILTVNDSCEDNMPPCAMHDPQCATGIPSGTSEKACCALGCGRCGGQGCDSLPGGGDACCKNNIAAAGRSCANNPPPCVMP